MDKSQMILDHMDMAEKIAWRYSYRQNVHRDEAVAEAYYQLTYLFLVDTHVYLAKPNIKTIGMYVKTRMVNYFNRQVKKLDPLVEDKIASNIDTEMVEYLSDVIGDDDKAFAVFDMIRGGLSLEEIMMVAPEFMRVVKRLRMQVAGRIQRIERMQELGMKPTRKIKTNPEVLKQVLSELTYKEEQEFLKSQSPSAENPPTLSP